MSFLRHKKKIAAYLATPVLVGLMTWVLGETQQRVIALEGHSTRPYAIGFVLVIACIAAWGGIGPGLAALLLTLVATGYVLCEPQYSWTIAHSRDLVEMFALLCVGGTVLFAFDIAQRARLRSEGLLVESEEARARLRALMDTAPVGVLTCDTNTRLTYANREAERIWGQPFQAVTMEEWGAYRLHFPDGTPMPPERSGLARALAGEEGPIQIEAMIPREKDAPPLWVQINSTPVRDPDGAILGALSVFNDITARKQIEEERAGHLRDAQARAEREALRNQIGQAQRLTDDPEAVQEIAVQELGRFLGVDRCYFATYHHERDRIRIGRDWHRADLPSLQSEFRISRFNADLEAIHESGRPLVVDDLQTAVGLSDETRQQIEALPLRAGITVPLMDEGKIVATLNVALTDQPRAWTAEEVELVQAVAAQTRSTMDAVRLIQHERNIAARLQEALTPSVPENVPGLDLASHYRPALAEANVGGDFFDVFVVADDCVALVIGDLSGKGLAAASQIATVRNMLRYALYRRGPLDEAMTILNDTLAAHDLLTGFATLFVGLFDRTAGRLVFVSCGHEPGLLRRAATGAVEELAATGAVLGAFRGARFEQTQVSMNDGDALILYTDGLSEAGRSRHDFLGASGLAALAASPDGGVETAEAIKGRIVAGVESHTQTAAHDDQCLLVVVASGGVS